MNFANVVVPIVKTEYNIYLFTPVSIRICLS